MIFTGVPHVLFLFLHMFSILLQNHELFRKVQIFVELFDKKNAGFGHVIFLSHLEEEYTMLFKYTHNKIQGI